MRSIRPQAIGSVTWAGIGPKGHESETIDDADPRPHQLDEPILAQSAQHAVDVRDTEAQDVRDMLVEYGGVPGHQIETTSTQVRSALALSSRNPCDP